MKPTGDDFAPRRDGWFEHVGTWEEVTVGTVIATGQSRKERWEIVEQSMATPVPFMHTLWMRAREQTSGREFTVTPRGKDVKVIILTHDPADTQCPPRTPPSDSEAVALLVEKLGATHLATLDEKTGEMTCPDYTYDSHLGGDAQIRLGLLEHMRIAHGMTVRDNMDLLETITLHGRAHDRESGLTKGGFPHRHTPEDMQLARGIR